MALLGLAEWQASSNMLDSTCHTSIGDPSHSLFVAAVQRRTVRLVTLLTLSSYDYLLGCTITLICFPMKKDNLDEY
jgi:hypothetical protein